MPQKCFPNLSQIQPSLPTSQSFKYYKNQNNAYIFLPILPIFIPNLSQIQPFLLISQSLKYCKNPKNPKFSQMHQKCFPNLSQIQPSLPTSHSFKYCKYQIKHTQFIIIIYIYSKFYPKIQPFLPISQSVKYCKIPKIIPNFPKCIRNVLFVFSCQINKYHEYFS